jgi:hypothetical protein
VEGGLKGGKEWKVLYIFLFLVCKRESSYGLWVCDGDEALLWFWCLGKRL